MNIKLALGIVAGVAAGGFVGYAIASSRFGQKAFSSAEKAIEDSDLRLPDPSYAMQIAMTDEEFDTLDGLVCECGSKILEDVDLNRSMDDVVTEIQDCVAYQLYPDFPWPPMTGDHPTAHQLYAELAVLARRAVATASVCPEKNA